MSRHELSTCTASTGALVLFRIWGLDGVHARACTFVTTHWGEGPGVRPLCTAQMPAAVSEQGGALEPQQEQEQQEQDGALQQLPAAEQQQLEATPPAHAPPAADEQDGLLPRAATPSCAPFHALEIHSVSSHDGSYDGRLKPQLAAVHNLRGLEPVHATDPTERLLPKPAPAAPPGGVLPSGMSRRERMHMVLLFSLTAALLYADQNLMAPNLTAIATGAGCFVPACTALPGAAWPTPGYFLIPETTPCTLLQTLGLTSGSAIACWAE